LKETGECAGGFGILKLCPRLKYVTVTVTAVEPSRAGQVRVKFKFNLNDGGHKSNLFITGFSSLRYIVVVVPALVLTPSQTASGTRADRRRHAGRREQRSESARAGSEKSLQIIFPME
jgi:hypothetical protein